MAIRIEFQCWTAPWSAFEKCGSWEGLHTVVRVNARLLGQGIRHDRYDDSVEEDVLPSRLRKAKHSPKSFSESLKKRSMFPREGAWWGELERHTVNTAIETVVQIKAEFDL